MKSEKIETLVNCGYAFLKSVNDNEDIYENKFTGLRVLYDFTRNSYMVLN